MVSEHRDLLGRDVVASDGAKLGHVADLYVDPGTGAPRWLVVPTGLFAGIVSFIPADGAVEDEDGRVVVRYTRKQVRKAPHPEADGDLTEAEEAALARHYLAAARAGDEQSDARGTDPTVEADLPLAPDDDPTDEWLIEPAMSDGTSMVRAEEEVRVDTPTRPAQRARLVKRVVIEHVTFTVPVRREVLHLEYEDIAEDEILDGPDREPFAPVPDQELVLFEEIVEYEKKIVPKERVRLRSEVVDEVIDLRTDVRKEDVEVVGGLEQPAHH